MVARHVSISLHLVISITENCSTSTPDEVPPYVEDRFRRPSAALRIARSSRRSIVSRATSSSGYRPRNDHGTSSALYSLARRSALSTTARTLATVASRSCGQMNVRTNEVSIEGRCTSSFSPDVSSRSFLRSWPIVFSSQKIL